MSTKSTRRKNAPGQGRPAQFKDRVPLNTYLERTEKDDLADLAAAKGMKAADLARQILREYLARDEVRLQLDEAREALAGDDL